MFSRFLARLCSHMRRAHRHHHPMRRVRASERGKSTRIPCPQPRGESLRPSPGRIDSPSQCPLCHKRCSFAEFRCKHGEAFKAWLASTHAPAEDKSGGTNV